MRFTGIHSTTSAIAGRIMLITILALYAPHCMRADSGHLRFSHISIDDGLSNSTVLSIAQDLDGNIWFGTFDGADRYDGYEFTVYRNECADSAGTSGNIIRTIYVDSRGKVWTGAWNQLSCYNPAKEGFDRYPLPLKAGANVRAIIETSDSTLLVGTDSEPLVFNMRNLRFDTEHIPDKLEGKEISVFCRHGDKTYIGTEDHGIYVLSSGTGSIRCLDMESPITKIQSITVQNENILWVGTEGNGLYRIYLPAMTVTRYTHSGKAGSISSNYIRSLALDSSNRLWVGTFNNLNIFDSQNDTFEVYSSDPSYPENLSARSVRSIFMDNQGGMWLGTYFGGLNYWHPLRNRFVNIRRNLVHNSLNDNVASCIIEDRDGTLWIGTNDGGVNHYNPETGHFSYFRLKGEDQKADLESDDIKAIYIDHASDRIYIGAHASGLNVLDKASGTIMHCGSSADNCPPRNIYAICPRDRDNLFIGALEGLYIFNKRTMRFSGITEEADGTPVKRLLIRTFFRDSGGRLWVGGENGLQVYDVRPDGVVSSSIPAKGFLDRLSFVQCIFESRDSTIWIATRNGLYSLRASGESRRYTVEDGLPNNSVYGIEEDSDGRLWLSTDNGLSCFNPETCSFRNFNAEDGLQSNQFNMYSHCRTGSGRMYFGGINGITTFIPEELEDNPYTPQPVISALYVFNRQVHPGDRTGILKESISCSRQISIPHEFNSFNLEFSVPNYISGQNNTFSYTLKGYDKEWYTLQDKRNAPYSNLPPGKYTFQLKAANSDGKWCGTPRELVITIEPAWYQTIAARILMALAAAALAIFIMKYIVDRKTMETKLELERKDKEHQEEINQMKMRFFINISHELRTPLTLIIAPIQDMIGKTGDIWMRRQLQYVERNAKRMLHLVNQLMDYRRAELGVFKLKVKLQDIQQLLTENFSYYEKLAAQKHLKYTLDSAMENRPVYIDGQYLELIVNNLLSNAFKYTDSGSITVRAALEGGDLILEVKDTGIGIPVDKQAKIFERFYQVEKQHIGSGIGLSLVQRLVELHHGQIEIESEEGKGSRFTVRIPQDPATYDKSEIASGEEEEAHSTNDREMYIVDTEKEDEVQHETVETKGWTVLVVEDNDEVRNYIRAGLEPSFNVRQAANGEEALRILKDKSADIVITDVIMPVMDGIKLCRQIKQDINTSHIPVIMLSAKTDVKEQLEAFHTGADDYIAKPFSMAVLMNKIKNMQKTRMRMLEHYSKSIEIEPEKITFNTADEDLLNQAISIVEKNLDNSEFSIAQFASEMNMSRSNLHSKLKAITGESALEFIRKIRFKEACRMLKEGKYSISEISWKVGFSTPSYFTTSFKKHFGCLPSEYLKNNG